MLCQTSIKLLYICMYSYINHPRGLLLCQTSSNMLIYYFQNKQYVDLLFPKKYSSFKPSTLYCKKIFRVKCNRGPSTCKGCHLGLQSLKVYFWVHQLVTLLEKGSWAPVGKVLRHRFFNRDPWDLSRKSVILPGTQGHLN